MKTPPTRRPSLQELAYTRLREAIGNGTLQSNARLREVEVAGWLRMSRTPVRDALRRLTDEGLLAPRDNRGVVVAALDYQAVGELYAMRESLDGTAAAMAAQRASAADIGVLRDILHEEAQAADAGARVLQQINRRFHTALYQSAHNRFLMKSISAINDALGLLDQATVDAAFRTSNLSNPDRPANSRREHLEIVEAIDQRNARTAEEAARAHVRSAHRERLRLMNQSVQRAGGVARENEQAA